MKEINFDKRTGIDLVIWYEDGSSKTIKLNKNQQVEVFDSIFA